MTVVRGAHCEALASEGSTEDPKEGSSLYAVSRHWGQVEACGSSLLIVSLNELNDSEGEHIEHLIRKEKV